MDLSWWENAQSDNLLNDRRWHSNIVDVLLCRGAECDTDHNLAVAKVRERMSGCKQAV
jgi:hypothetical protein